MSLVRGILLGSDAADRLLVQASPAEIAQFGSSGQAVRVLPDSPPSDPWLNSFATGDCYLYDAAGHRVALVTEVSVDHPSFDVTTHNHVSMQCAIGMRRVRITAVGI